MSPRPHLRTCALIGLGMGLLAFAAESALVMRQNAIGLNIDVEGPYAALMAAVRPHVPGLLARIGAAYALAGVAAALLAGLLSRLWRLRRRGRASIVFALNLLALVVLVVWDRAIVRPALFDDLAWFGGALGWLVAHGEPWHPRAVAAVILLAQLAVGAARTWGRARVEWLRPAVTALVLVAAGTQLWANTLPAGGPSEERERVAPNAGDQKARLIVLFGIDAFRTDRLSAFGGSGKVAPHLEALLREGAFFTNAWTPIAQTEPAWRSLLTARWPQRTGVRYPLTAESRWLSAPTFAEQLAQAGWHTTFATDCSRFNYQPQGTGFAERRQPPRGAVNFVLEKLRYRLLGTFADNALGARFVPELIENRALAGLHDPAGYAERLGQALVERAEQGPALLAFHATAAHFPGDPSYPFHRAFVRPDAPQARRLRMFFSPIPAGEPVQRAAEEWTRADAENLFDELLAQADAQLGTVIAGLKEAGLYDDAAIIVFSDHGESFHEDHPELAGATSVHGARLQEAENRILLVVKPPGAPAPRRVEDLVRLVDLGPTILELAGVPALEDVDGVSLAPLLRGEPLPSQWLYAETGFTHASPAAFDPAHLAVAARSFDIYRVRRDGVVEIGPETHEQILREKDVGAFDGQRWLVRAPRADGTVEERCAGACPAPEELRDFLDRSVGATPHHAGSGGAPMPASSP